MSSFTVSRSYENLSTRLDLYSTSDLSDVAISCSGREFRAHSFVLAERSSFFRAMLSSNLKEGQAGHHITLDIVNSDLMEKILPYLYGADLELLHDNLLDVLKLSDMWMLEELKQACEKEFPEIVTQENALEMREIALTYRCPEKVVDFCEKQFFKRLDRGLHAVDEFLHIPHKLLKRYFVDYQCAITDEIDVLSAINRWWKFDEENRTKYLQDLLTTCVRQEDVDKESLSRYIAFLKPYVAEDNQFVTCVSSLPIRNDSQKFPLARCGRKQSQDGIVFASTRKSIGGYAGRRKLNFVRCWISGMNDELVFGKVQQGPQGVRNLVLSGEGDWIYQEMYQRTGGEWYVFNSSNSKKEKLDFCSAHFVVRKEGYPVHFVVAKDCDEYYDIQTLKVHQGKWEWVRKNRRAHFGSRFPAFRRCTRE